MKILCIGATNKDIIGISKREIVREDSNPGRVHLELGGVAKNIAENLFRLGEEVELLTFVGKDAFGKDTLNYLSKLGIRFSKSLIDDLHPTGVYMAVHGFSGELIAAINDFSLIESITPQFFDAISDYIESFDTLVFDTNLSESTLTYLIEKYQHKMIICDGVSQAKVRRLESVLKYVDLLKVNKQELSTLLNQKNDDVIMDVKNILKSGIKHIVVTNGKDAITYNTEGRVYQSLIFEPAKIKSSAGAGDALISGIIYGLNRGKSMHEAMNLGKKAASLTMEVDQACNPLLSKDLIEE